MYGIHILVTQLTPKKSQLCQFTKSSTGKTHISTLIGNFFGHELDRIEENSSNKWRQSCW